MLGTFNSDGTGPFTLLNLSYGIPEAEYHRLLGG